MTPAGPEDGTRPLAFGPFVADPESGRLFEGSRQVPLAPKPFETLLYLARRSGHVVSRTELMSSLWPGTFVTDDVLVQSVMEIRRALGDNARTPQYVQTVPRRGYQFLVPVRHEVPAGDPVPVPVPAPAPVPVSAPAPAPVSAPVPAPAARFQRPAVIAAAAAVSVVLLALGMLLPRGAGAPAASPALLPPEPGSLLVLPIAIEEPAPESEWLREGLAEMIRSQLGQTPGLQVVARHRLAGAVAEAGGDPLASPAAAVRLARGLRAEHMISGSFVRVADRFVLNAQIVEVDRGRTEGTASVRGRMPADLLDAVDELCLKLLHHLSPARTGGASKVGPVRLTTRSVEASRSYIEALARFARGGRQGAEEAEGLLDEALKLDSSFAQAYLKKAEIQHWRRRWGYGNPDPAPAVRAAALLMKELPNREKLLVESFEALIIRQQPSAALRSWNALLQFYPTYAQEVGVPGLVADTLMMEGRWDELILVGESHVDSPSLPDAERARLSSLLAQAFRRKGEMEPALRHAQRAVRLWPAQDGPAFLQQRTSLGRIALEAGRREGALSEFEAVAGSPDADVPNLVNAAWGFYMAGEAGQARALVDRAIALDPSYGNAFHLRGWMELAAGNYGAAAASLVTAFEQTPTSFGSAHQGLVNGDLAALYYAGVAYQKRGEWEKGEPLLERLIAHCRHLQQLPGYEAGTAAAWQAASFIARGRARLGLKVAEPPRLAGDDTTYFVQSARLHAVQGRKEEALRELAQGIALGHGELRHIQDDPDFDTLRGEAEFQRLVSR
jgi:DNA-binding winged helix-turn-helix (wHTH) protein/tetratricopeptide (TPR) repeat protein/TolB-like protein